jgi:hypothetical protein
MQIQTQTVAKTDSTDDTETEEDLEKFGISV